MTFESGTAMVDSNVTAPVNERTRRRRIRLAAAAAAVALAAGVGGWTVMDGTSESSDAPLPAVVLGETLQPLSVYERSGGGQLSLDPVVTLHVRFAMLRQGPGASNWELTFVAPEEARSAVSTLGGRRHLVIRADGNEHLLGLSYPADFDGVAVNFFALFDSRSEALALANLVTTSVVEGPPMGGLAS